MDVFRKGKESIAPNLATGKDIPFPELLYCSTRTTAVPPPKQRTQSVGRQAVLRLLYFGVPGMIYRSCTVRTTIVCGDFDFKSNGWVADCSSSTLIHVVNMTHHRSYLQ